MTMKTLKLLLLALISGSMLLFTACSQSTQENTEDAVESAAEDVEDAGEEAMDAAEDAADEIDEEM